MASALIPPLDEEAAEKALATYGTLVGAANALAVPIGRLRRYVHISPALREALASHRTTQDARILDAFPTATSLRDVARKAGITVSILRCRIAHNDKLRIAQLEGRERWSADVAARVAERAARTIQLKQDLQSELAELRERVRRDSAKLYVGALTKLLAAIDEKNRMLKVLSRNLARRA